MPARLARDRKQVWSRTTDKPASLCARAQGWQADRAASRAPIAAADDALMAQPGRCVVYNRHMATPLTGNLKLEAGWR